MEISPACLKCGCAMKIISLMQIPSRPNCHSNQLFPARLLLLLLFIWDLSWGCSWLRGKERREILEARREGSPGRAGFGEQRHGQGRGSAWGWGRPSFLKSLWPDGPFPALSAEVTAEERGRLSLGIPRLVCWGVSASRAKPEHPPTHFTLLAWFGHVSFYLSWKQMPR